MEGLTIEVINSVWCCTNCREQISQCLMLRKEYWRKENIGGRRKRSEYEVCMVDGKGFFLTGFLPRVINHLEKSGVPFTILNNTKKLDAKNLEIISGMKLFEDQERLRKIVQYHQRGAIESPTGTGKTVLAYAIISSLKTKKSLIICPTISIADRTNTKFSEEYGLKTSMIKAGSKDLSGDVVIAIVNSLYNMNPDEYKDKFDLVIVDEGHRASSIGGMYYKILTKLEASAKIGMTATNPNEKESMEKSMAYEGLIGPVIGEFTMREATEKNRIAKPKLILLSVPPNTNIRELSRYNDTTDRITGEVSYGIYTVGIERNRIRNSAIASFLKKHSGKTSMVFVRTLEHSRLLSNIISDRGINCKIITGESHTTDREEIRSKLNSKEIDCVIATSAWKEGIDVPSLDIVVNAAGYLASTPVIQMAGRVTRSCEGKKECWIVDMLDIGKFLSVHCVARIQTYASLGWLINSDSYTE